MLFFYHFSLAILFIGIIKQVLSFKVWIPLSRLTYCAYLLNPFIIHAVRLHDESPVHLEFLSLVNICNHKKKICPIVTAYCHDFCFQGTMFMGQVMITYFCAYALSLMAEAPFVMLMRLLIQSRNKRKFNRREIIISHTKL